MMGPRQQHGHIPLLGLVVVMAVGLLMAAGVVMVASRPNTAGHQEAVAQALAARYVGATSEIKHGKTPEGVRRTLAACLEPLMLNTPTQQFEPEQRDELGDTLAPHLPGCVTQLVEQTRQDSATHAEALTGDLRAMGYPTP